nr:immunoglobulin light chain junction region [Macaca mulatta]
CMQSIKVPFTF